jgi:hypothetical protein
LGNCSNGVGMADPCGNPCPSGRHWIKPQKTCVRHCARVACPRVSFYIRQHSLGSWYPLASRWIAHSFYPDMHPRTLVACLGTFCTLWVVQTRFSLKSDFWCPHAWARLYLGYSPRQLDHDQTCSLSFVLIQFHVGADDSAHIRGSPSRIHWYPSGKYPVC